jgi:hypothetical protein
LILSYLLRDTEPIPKANFEGENREQSFSFLKNRIKPANEELDLKRPLERKLIKNDGDKMEENGRRRHKYIFSLNKYTFMCLFNSGFDFPGVFAWASVSDGLFQNWSFFGVF